MILFIVRRRPINNPFFSNASSAYEEQVGLCLQLDAIYGETHLLYTIIGSVIILINAFSIFSILASKYPLVQLLGFQFYV